MEFTWHGLVRYGFGFYNPNHAAAAITMLLPFLWAWRRWLGGRQGGWRTALGIGAAWLAEAVLYAGLLMTYSRAGMLALALSGGVWLAAARRADGADAARRRRLRRELALAGALLLGGAVLSGAGARYVATDSAAAASAGNRLDVWRAGCALLADNPGGVGAGNSGKAVTWFYAPPGGGEYRTLVNSFLTFTAERGAVPGLLLLGLWAAAAAGFFLVCFRMAVGAVPSFLPLGMAGLGAALAAAAVNGSLSTCFDAAILENCVRGARAVYGEKNDRLQAGLAVAAMLLPIAGCLMTVRVFRARPCPAKNLRLWLAMTSAFVLLVACAGYVYGRQAARGFPGTRIRKINGERWAFTPCRVLPGKFTASGRKAVWCVVLPDETVDGRGLRRFMLANFSRWAYPLSETGNDWEKALAAGGVPPARAVLVAAGAVCGNFKTPASFAGLYYYLPSVPPAGKLPGNLRAVWLSAWDERGENGMWESAAVPGIRYLR